MVIGADGIYHLRDDRVEWVSVAKLEEVFCLVTEIVESLQDKTPEWTRESKRAQT
mgnify:CR=1 FL=1